MKLTPKGITLIAGVAIILFLTVAYNVQRKTISSMKEDLRYSRDSVKTYTIKYGRVVASAQEKNAIIMSQNDAIKKGELEIKRLKALHLKDVVANVKLEALVKVLRDSLDLPPEVKIITIKDSSGQKGNYMKLPAQILKEENRFMKLDAGVDSLGKAWYDLSDYISGEITIAYKRDGLFKTKPVGIFTTENQNLKVKDINALIIKEEKKFYQKPWFWFVSGVGITTFVSVVKK